MKIGDYIKNKELGIISIIEFDCFQTGKVRERGVTFQIKAVELPFPNAHGCYVGNCGWKTNKELLRDYEVINYKDNKKTMKITNLVKKILDADTRKLVKAGFINGDLALTDEGTGELLGILFLEKKEELVKIADEKIKDENNN